MKRFIIITATSILALVTIISCLPDRMPPEPVEISRPEFVGFGNNDSGGINIPLDDPVIMVFNEGMKPKSFQENFELSSISGSISGTFATDNSADSAVIFTPVENMQPAERYEAKLFGGVRDLHGNSLLSPNEEDVPQTTWFFTTGAYAEGGYPYAYISDKLGEMIYRVGSINEYKDSKRITTASREMRMTPDGSYLFIVNKANPGYVNILDPATMNEVTTIDLGVGSEHIFISEQKAYISDISGKTVSIVDLNSLTLETILSFDDGFRPRDIVYSQATNKIYLSSNDRGDYAKIRVIDADNYNNYYDVDNILPNSRTLDMEISADGEYIFLTERRTPNLVIFSTSMDTTVTTIKTDYFQNDDGVVTENAYYFVSTALDNRTGIFKLDLSTLAITDQLEIPLSGLSSLDATAAGELLYVVSERDSTLKILETSSLTKIAEVKVPGSLNTVTVSEKNY